MKIFFSSSIYKKPLFWILLIILIIIIFFILRPEKSPTFESEVVTLSTVSEIISGTGSVTASEDVNLSFEISGTVSSINFKEGDRVLRGQVLASLDRSILESDVENVRASLAVQESKLSEMYAGTSQTEQNVSLARLQSAELALENARHNLLTTDIRAYFTGNHVGDSGSSYDPPEITGNYIGEEEGKYVLSFYPSGTVSGYSFNYSGLERGNGEATSEKPVPIGSKGLYIQFPKNFARGSGDIEWTIEIPNRRSNKYISNKQAYDKALKNWQEAKANYELSVEGPRSEQISAQEASVEQARASLIKAQTSLSKSSLISPVDGVIKNLNISVGETVSSGQVAFSVVSDDEYYITVYIPETDVANLKVGDMVEVNFNSFPNENFEAEVGFVSPVAEQRDGVTVFKTRVYLLESDNRIRVGMTADLDIFSETKEDVFSVPGRSVIRSGNRMFVRVVEDRNIIERDVIVGLRGYDGRLEIVEGLNLGDEVVVFITENDLSRFTN